MLVAESAQGGIAPVAAVGVQETKRCARSSFFGRPGDDELRLGGEGDLFGDMGFGAAGGVDGPGRGQVQAPVDKGAPVQ
ncbi:hypothetical protein GCM10010517_75870 [Streptosporangium fragile]|uniref:Uncharacterized protein n=1 Tax=Streptosporangium fragile TaxID=46186 RepID=A0ABN3WDS0_9ACTN